MNSIRRRHPELSPASPHKLRHTGATLARRAGVSLEDISEALTHSDKQVTKIYVNTTDTVNQTVGEIAFRNLKNNEIDQLTIYIFPSTNFFSIKFSDYKNILFPNKFYFHTIP